MICDYCGEDVEPDEFELYDGICQDCHQGAIEVHQSEVQAEREYIKEVRTLRDESEIDLYLMETEGNA
jgi:Zn finger protein HypA/HybF involved in hydrogenase expression